MYGIIIRNGMAAKWCCIRKSKLWMKEHEKAWKDNKEPNQLNVFQGFLSVADSGI